MNIWIALVIGLLIGGLIALLAAVFYWRKQRLYLESKLAAAQASLEAVQSEKKALERSHQTQTLQLETLQFELKAKKSQILLIQDELQTYKSQTMKLNKELAAHDQKIDDLGKYIFELKEALTEKNQKFEGLRTQISNVDNELNGLGLNSLSNGSGLAVTGFVGSLKNRLNGMQKDIATKEDELVALQTDVDVKDKYINNLEMHLSSCQENQAAPQSTPIVEGPRGLSMIWGLSTEANRLLEEKGIYSYSQLAAVAAADIDAALSASSRYYPGRDNQAIHTSWVEQTQFAINRDWYGLSQYQQQFDTADLRDDLKIVWGIGPKIENVLNNNGIYLFSQLASAPAERITEILREAGPRFSLSTQDLHQSWPEQARLADSEEWEPLAALKLELARAKANKGEM